MSWWIETTFKKILEKIEKLLKEQDSGEICSMKG